MAAPRQWAVFDKWDAGGFLAGGSFRAGTRYNSLNMQRYSNGSIGPRPGWRKLTNTVGTAAVPTVVAANKANLTKYGGFWLPSTADVLGDIMLFGSTTDTISRRIKLDTDGQAIYNAAPNFARNAGYAVDLNGAYERSGVGSCQGRSYDGSAVIGSLNTYTDGGAIGSVTARTISAVVAVTRKAVLYRGRMFAWDSTGANSPYVVYSSSSSLTDYSTSDSGAFTLGGASPQPRGCWALPGGLLIFAYAGRSTFKTPYVPAGGTDMPRDEGFWYMLTGATPATGTLVNLSYDIGPAYYNLAIQSGDRVLFPIQRRGWAVHDGSRLDKSSLADLRPGRGILLDGTQWLPGVSVMRDDAFVLPFYVSDTDASTTTTTSGAVVGENFATGHGSFEFVNGAWNEQLYLHGQGDPFQYGYFGDTFLFAIHADSADAGTNYIPAVYTRDLKLDRPATTSSLSTYNGFSSGTETAPTQSGGRTGTVFCRLETGEFMLPNYLATRPASIIIDYDYWNSSLFPTAGFDVDLIYRDITSNELVTMRVNTAPITPPGTSTLVAPKRARAVLNLPARVATGTFQVRLDNLVGCAIHAIAVAHDPEDPASVR
jgi:hypothetical protein